MTAAEIINKYEELGVRFWVDGGQLHFRAPSGVLDEQRKEELRFYKESLIQHLKDMDSCAVAADPANRYAPFPLTDVQTAYLVGRNNIYEYGGVGCHVYSELTMPVLERERLEKAWHSVIKRHDMLRASVFPEGYQQVLENIALPALEAQDLRGLSPAGVQTCIRQIREKLSTKQYKPEQWPLYDLFLTTTDENSILHLSIDMLIADFVSVNIMLAELEHFYYEPEKPLPELEVTYRDLILFQQSQQKHPMKRAQKERDRRYWMERIDQMPEAPELPVAGESKGMQKIVFRQHKLFLDRDRWNFVCRQAKQQKITPSGVILAAYAEVLGLWSGKSGFCINITMLNRPDLHPQISSIIGDFTVVDILEVAPEKRGSFLERARTLQKRLWQDLEHISFSGIEVLREANRRRGKNVLIPVVYTSTVGVGESTKDGEFMRNAHLTYKISQTPQVWIDCQATEQNGGVLVNWDVRNGIFPEGMIEDAFEAFEQLLYKIADSEDIWQKRFPLELPSHVKATRESVNNTVAPMPEGLLPDGFYKNVKNRPDAPALFGEGRYLTYRELADYAGAVRQALSDRGCKKGNLVAVILEKGVWQIASVLGILFAGCVYLPVDASQPLTRQNTILEDSGTRFVLIHGGLAEQEWNANVSLIEVEQLKPEPKSCLEPAAADPSQQAYIIYTSGSTGKPKGVVISHCAALNTIKDINKRFKVNRDDKILGLASLAFDLSVYDIFGTLTAGGTLILPEAKRQKDPRHWYELIIKHGITIWNSVPAQMQMLLSCLKSEQGHERMPLRLALLSGDWIPVTLPGILREHCPDVKAVSLGGATEAAIWSIFHQIENIPEGANSIPYGTPLSNQSFYVLNEQMQPCPDWTTGNLYIGGAGLALEYLGDPKLTSERFIVHPETKERLYRTGDIGRYQPDGVIEFLGREDTQVKIRGHRIELQEIESVLQKHPSVSGAVAMVSGNTRQGHSLAAFVEPCRLPFPDRSVEERADLCEVCYQTGEKETAAVDRSLFAQWIKISDRTALLDIMKTFRDAGLFKDSDARHNTEEIQTALKILPKYHRLIKRWLNALCSERLLQRDASAGKYSLKDAPLEDDAASLCWKELERIEEQVHFSGQFLHYLKKSSSHLTEMLQGEVDPLELLFPQGKLETAMAAYHDNLINRCLNRVTGEAVLFLADQHTRSNPGRPLRILEIGAGVGGTSIDLIPALSERHVEYYFTDVSTFFLNEARTRFVQYPWVSYGLFDINKEYWAQGLSACSWDIIICANVLHNSLNGEAVLSSLKELAVPGGALIVIEATRESYALLTSMEFEYSLTQINDFRKDNDQVFFSREQWRKMLSGAGADILCAYPENDDVLASSGQTIFIARFIAESEKISSEEIKNYLHSQLPEYMIPGRIEVLPRISLSSNGKVDRAALKRRIENIGTSAFGSGEAPQDDLETRIADIWGATLNREIVGRSENFYEAGGDSLLVAQVVAIMRETLPEAKSWEWERLMLEMLRTPTVAGIGEKLRYEQKDEAAVKDGNLTETATPLVILAEGKEPGGAVKVLFHDGTGTLTPYNNLLPHLINDPERTETIAGFIFGDEKNYLSNPCDKLITNLGQQYAELLLRKGASRFELIGYCMGGLIAVETARALLEAGAKVAPVITIDTRLCGRQIDNELLMERAFGLLIGADIFRAGHVVEDELLRKALGKLVASKEDVISTEELCSLSGPFESTARCFRQLASKPQAQRLEELYSTVPALEANGSEHQVERIQTLYRIFRHSFKGVMAYEPLPFAGDVRTMRCIDETAYFIPFMDLFSVGFWEETILGDLQIAYIEGNHITCMQAPNAGTLAKLLTGGDKK